MTEKPLYNDLKINSDYFDEKKCVHINSVA